VKDKVHQIQVKLKALNDKRDSDARKYSKMSKDVKTLLDWMNKEEKALLNSIMNDEEDEDEIEFRKKQQAKEEKSNAKRS